MARNGTTSSAAFFGETGAIIRSKDWSTTPVGPLESWPQSLKTALSICLGSKQPMFVWWKTGERLTIFYNDAYIPIAGAKHPDQIGADCWSAKGWAEMRPYLQPLVDQVFNERTANWSDNMLLPLYRQEGFLEEGYFSFSYSPIIGEGGEVAGMYCATSETTRQVLSERRLKLLRNLGTGTALSSAEEVATHAAAQLADDPRDIPFSLLYLVEPGGAQATLAAASSISVGEVASPMLVPLDPDDATSVWPLAEVLESGRLTQVRGLRARLPRDLPTEAWSEPPDSAAILPIQSPGQSRPAGCLVVGLSPRLHLDHEYESFLNLVAGHVATNLTNARAVEAERRRAEELAELDRVKTAFFSNVSHEFRTPLTLMLGPLEEELRENPVASERLRVAHRNSLRLLKLVNTLLDFSRIEAGRLQASYEPTDLAAATVDLASVFRSAIEKAGLSLRVDCPALPEPVYVDREMWEKIVLNLLSNAFKFTFDGEIALGLRWCGEHVELSVCDSGVGIPADELPRIFDRFHRVRGTRSRTHEGTGIGLALVQEFARLHGGDVRAESVEGRGTTFIVSLRTGTAHLPSDRLSETCAAVSTGVDPQSFLDDVLRSTSTRTGVAATDIVRDGQATSPAGSRAVSATRPRILLADDNADMRDYVTNLLSDRWDVIAVADGAAALVGVRDHKPDLVLADVMMPGLDGFELLSALRADTATSGIPVVLLSARAGEEATLAGIAAGADDYLVKPFTARDLLTRIEAQLTRAQVRDAVAESEQRLRAFVTATSDAVYRMSADWSELRHLGGRSFIADTLDPSRGWLEKYIHPDDRPTLLAAIRRAIDTKSPFEMEHRVYRVDGTLGWAFSRAVPMLGADGEIAEWVGTARDVTARKHDEEVRRASEERQAFLLALSDRLRPLADAAEIVAAASEALGRHLGVGRCGYGEVDSTGGFFTIEHDWTDGRMASAAGTHRVDDFGSELMAVCRAGRTLVIDDVLSDVRARGVEDAYQALGGVRASLAVPLLREARWAAAFYVQQTSARQWTADEAALAREVAERTWAAVGRARTEEALRRSDEQLRDANRRKDEFLAMLAHELRNPLAPVRTGLELIRALGNTPASVERVRGMMERQIGHMVRLIDDLLDVSRITSGKIQLHREPTSLTDVISSAIDANRAAMLAKDIRIELDLPEPAVVVDVDPTRFVQIVSNLLHNATKFTEAGGSVTVSARVSAPQPRRPSEVTISVLDTGIGITATLLPHVFDLFMQGDGPSSQPGLGIGLALAKRLVEMQDGSIEARSDGEGHGSEFVIRMPIVAGPAQARVSDAVHASRVRCRVVVIDDNRDAAEVMTMLVETLGGECRATFDGETGLREVLSYRPDVVLLDIGMPGVDGHETCRRIRRELGDNVLIVAVTGFGREQDKAQAAQAGFDAHLTKPADPRVLEKLLQRRDISR